MGFSHTFKRMQTDLDQPFGGEPEPIGQLLDKLRLSQVLSKVQTLHSLDQLLPNILPLELITQCRVINKDNTTLVLEVDSASWATRLRYAEPEFLRQAQQYTEFAGITKLKIKVRSS